MIALSRNMILNIIFITFEETMFPVGKILRSSTYITQPVLSPRIGEHKNYCILGDKNPFAKLHHAELL